MATGISRNGPGALRLATCMLVLVALCLGGVACAGGGGAGGGGTGVTAGDAAAAQDLPRHPARLASQSLHLQLARTAAERTVGLMHRTAMPADEGMLFCYPEPQPMVFWMKNTILPLDLLFFDADLRLNGWIAGMQPGIGIPDAQLPRYPSPRPAQYALEVNAGSVQAWGLREGDTLDIALTLLHAEP